MTLFSFSRTSLRLYPSPGIWSWNLLLCRFPSGWQINIGRVSLVHYYTPRKTL